MPIEPWEGKENEGVRPRAPPGFAPTRGLSIRQSVTEPSPGPIFPSSEEAQLRINRNPEMLRYEETKRKIDDENKKAQAVQDYNFDVNYPNLNRPYETNEMDEQGQADLTRGYNIPQNPGNELDDLAHEKTDLEDRIKRVNDLIRDTEEAARASAPLLASTPRHGRGSARPVRGDDGDEEGDENDPRLAAGVPSRREHGFNVPAAGGGAGGGSGGSSSDQSDHDGRRDGRGSGRGDPRGHGGGAGRDGFGGRGGGNGSGGHGGYPGGGGDRGGGGGGGRGHGGGDGDPPDGSIGGYSYGGDGACLCCPHVAGDRYYAAAERRRKQQNMAGEELRQRKKDLLDELKIVETRAREVNETRKRRQLIYPKVLPWDERIQTFKSFFLEFLHRENFKGSSEDEKRHCLIASMKDPKIRQQLIHMLTVNPELPVSKLAGKLVAIRGGESIHDCREKVKNLKRSAEESVADWAMRVKSTVLESVAPEDLENLYGTATYSDMVLTPFLEGLNNRFLLSRCLERNVRSLDQAVMECTNLLQEERRLRRVTRNVSDVPIDRELRLQGGNTGQSPRNQHVSYVDLDEPFEDLPEEPEIEEEFEPVLAIRGNRRGRGGRRGGVTSYSTPRRFANFAGNASGGSAGNAVTGQGGASAGNRPPNDYSNVQCYNCNRLGHISRFCPSAKNKTKSSANVTYTKSPAQLRAVKRRKRFDRAGNMVAEVQEEEEDEEENITPLYFEDENGEIVEMIDEVVDAVDETPEEVETTAEEEAEPETEETEEVNAVTRGRGRGGRGSFRSRGRGPTGRRGGVRTSYSAPGRSFNWIGPAEQVHWGFRPNMAQIDVAGLGEVYCDSGADLNLIGPENIPEGSQVIRRYTNIFDVSGNKVESATVVIISIALNEEFGRLEVSEGGVPIEFVVLPSFPTVMGIGAMSDLNINLSFACYDPETRRASTIEGGWTHTSRDGQIWVCPSGILLTEQDTHLEIVSDSDSDSSDEKQRDIIIIMGSNASLKSESSSENEMVMNMSSINRPNIPTVLLEQEIQRQKQLDHQSLDWDYFAMFDEYSEESNSTYYSDISYHREDHLEQVAGRWAPFTEVEETAEDEEGVVWDPYTRCWTQHVENEPLDDDHLGVEWNWLNGTWEQAGTADGEEKLHRSATAEDEIFYSDDEESFHSAEDAIFMSDLSDEETVNTDTLIVCEKNQPINSMHQTNLFHESDQPNSESHIHYLPYQRSNDSESSSSDSDSDPEIQSSVGLEIDNILYSFESLQQKSDRLTNFFHEQLEKYHNTSIHHPSHREGESKASNYSPMRDRLELDRSSHSPTLSMSRPSEAHSSSSSRHSEKTIEKSDQKSVDKNEPLAQPPSFSRSHPTFIDGPEYRPEIMSGRNRETGETEENTPRMISPTFLFPRRREMNEAEREAQDNELERRRREWEDERWNENRMRRRQEMQMRDEQIARERANRTKQWLNGTRQQERKDALKIQRHHLGEMKARKRDYKRAKEQYQCWTEIANSFGHDSTDNETSPSPHRFPNDPAGSMDTSSWSSSSSPSLVNFWRLVPSISLSTSSKSDSENDKESDTTSEADTDVDSETSTDSDSDSHAPGPDEGFSGNLPSLVSTEDESDESGAESGQGSEGGDAGGGQMVSDRLSLARALAWGGNWNAVLDVIFTFRQIFPRRRRDSTGSEGFGSNETDNRSDRSSVGLSEGFEYDWFPEFSHLNSDDFVTDQWNGLFSHLPVSETPFRMSTPEEDEEQIFNHLSEEIFKDDRKPHNKKKNKTKRFRKRLKENKERKFRERMTNNHRLNHQHAFTYTAEDYASALTGSSLPFARIQLLSSGEADWLKALALLDSGASVNLINEETLLKTGWRFTKHPIDTKISSFTGDRIITDYKVKLDLSFGNGKVYKDIYFNVFRIQSPFEVLLGYPTMGLLNMELLPKDRAFKIDGYPFPLHTDHKDKAIVNSIPAPAEINLEEIRLEIGDGFTLQRGDDLLATTFSEGNKGEIGTAYVVELDPRWKALGLEVVEHVVSFYPYSKKRGNPNAASVLLHLNKEAKDPYVSLKSKDILGKLLHILPASQEGKEIFKHSTNCVVVTPICFVGSEEEAKEQLELEDFSYRSEAKPKRKPEEIRDSIPAEMVGDIVRMFPVPRHPTKQEDETMKKHMSEREGDWTREKIKDGLGEGLKGVPEKFKKEVVEVFFEERGCLARNNSDLTDSCRSWMVDAVYPETFSRHIKQPAVGMNLRLLHARLQRLMIKRGWAEPSDQPPVCSHPFFAILRKGGKIPQTAEAIDEVTEDFLDASFRILVDCSSLGTRTTAENQAVVSRAPTELPSVAETLARICDNCLSSGLDLKVAFFQILLTERARRLFGFESAIPEAVTCQLRILVMGQSCSPRLCSFIFRSCLDVISSFNLNLSFKRFVQRLEMPRSQLGIPDQRLIFPLALTSYLDDLLLQSPKAGAQGQYELTDDSYYKPPKDDEQRGVFLHLMLLKKTLRTLRHHNLLISLSKATILSQDCVKFMGYYHEKGGMSLLQETRSTIESIARPTNMRSAMRLLGMANYFSCLVKNLRPLCTFLSDKLRKNQPWTWNATDDESLEKLKQALLAGHVAGFRWLTGTGSGSNILLILMSDWCHETNSSCAVLLVKGTEENGTIAIKPALYYSKHLPESFRGKSSLLGELASLVQALCAMRSVVAGRCLRCYSDSMSMVAAINRRMSAKVCSDCPMAQRLMAMSLQFSFEMRFVPGESNTSADFLSRYEHARGKTLQTVLDSGDLYADFQAVDECMFRDITKESIEDFMKRSRKNEQLLIDLEKSIGNDDAEIRKIFSKSHVFAALSDGMEFVLPVEEGDHVDPLITYFQSEQLPTDKMGITEETFQNVQVLSVLEETAECFTPSDVQRDMTENDVVDQLSWSLAPVNTSAQTAKSLERSRQDSAFMVDHEPLRSALLNPMDGLLPDTVDTSGQYLADYQREMHYLVASLKFKKINFSDEALFDSTEELMANLPRARLSEETKDKKKYYLEIQKREVNISTIFDLLQGKIAHDHYDVDILRRTDRLFHRLYLNLKNLIIIDGLLFIVKPPRKYESAAVCLVMNENDARRQVTRYHSIYLHRGVNLVFAIASRKIYTIDLWALCLDVVKRCKFCSQYFAKKRLGPNLFPNFIANTSQDGLGIANHVFCDCKGPLATKNGQKGYVLVTVCLVTNFVTFHFLSDCRAETLAKTLFDNYIVNFGNLRTFVSDWGPNLIGKVTRELFHITGTKVRLTSARSARGNQAERFVYIFSKALNSLLIGKPLDQWKQLLPLVAFYCNSCYCSTFLNQTPYELQAFGKYSSFYSPLVILKKADISHLEPLWQQKIKMMRTIADLMRKHYGAYLSVARPKLHTVESLGITEGSRVYFKIYEYNSRLAYFSSLLPKFGTGIVIKTLSRTSLLIKNDATGRTISRHLTDVFPFKPAPIYGNVYTNPLQARVDDVMEGERDVTDVSVDAEEAGREFEAIAKTAENEALKDPEAANLKNPADEKEKTQQEVDAETDEAAKNFWRKSRRLKNLEPENQGL